MAYKDPEKRRAYARASYARNKKKISNRRKAAWRKNTNGVRAKQSARCHIFYERNKEREKRRSADWVKRPGNKEKKAETARRYREKNKKRITQNKRRWSAERKHKLSDSYVALTLNTKIKAKFIPIEIIEAKRAHLQLTRLLKKTANQTN